MHHHGMQRVIVLHGPYCSHIKMYIVSDFCTANSDRNTAERMSTKRRKRKQTSNLKKKEGINAYLALVLVLDNELYVFNADLRVAISKSQLTTCRVALIDLIVSGGQKKYLFFHLGLLECLNSI